MMYVNWYIRTNMTLSNNKCSIKFSFSFTLKIRPDGDPELQNIVLYCQLQEN